MTEYAVGVAQQFTSGVGRGCVSAHLCWRLTSCPWTWMNAYRGQRLSFCRCRQAGKAMGKTPGSADLPTQVTTQLGRTQSQTAPCVCVLPSCRCWSNPWPLCVCHAIGRRCKCLRSARYVACAPPPTRWIADGATMLLPQVIASHPAFPEEVSVVFIRSLPSPPSPSPAIEAVEYRRGFGAGRPRSAVSSEAAAAAVVAACRMGIITRGDALHITIPTPRPGSGEPVAPRQCWQTTSVAVWHEAPCGMQCGAGCGGNGVGCVTVARRWSVVTHGQMRVLPGATSGGDGPSRVGEVSEPPPLVWRASV